MATPAPKPSINTGVATPGSTPTSGSAFAKALASMQSTTNPYAIPTKTETTYLTQTSQPDIESAVNSIMQQLVGRFATPAEIKQYGAELLAAEKANPGLYTGETTYQQSGKRATVSGTQLSSGVDATAFLKNLIAGSANAKEYQAATTYFDAMNQANNQFRSAYSG